MIRVRVIASGTVQGVFFRDSCRREAVGRQVAGWVRNLPDGSVEAVFEGARENVDAMVAWARQGPPAASVTALDVYAQDPVEGLRGFEVRA
jgi:acylphosphatase